MAEQVTRTARLQLLGGWRLHLPGGHPLVLGATAQRVLALLALHGPLSRSQVTGRLWPDVSDTTASGRLRTTLWRLAGERRLLLHDEDGRLRLDHLVDVDVTRACAVAAAIAAGQEGSYDPAMFAADLLPTWYGDDWLIIDRERIRQIRLHALESLSAQLTLRGRYDGAVGAGLMALASDPLRESAHRAVIVAHLAEGNVADAYRQFEACRALLYSELGVSPSGHLVALVGGWSGHVAPAAPVVSGG
ncbi:MAG TPA: BTAD domain-containing putative transcriptional regulator [Actinomycetales bacterium]|nr:BTAD domain-containing putative transcriptional regulator [Actinomycetales bacterium]